MEKLVFGTWTKTQDHLPPEPDNSITGHSQDHYLCTVSHGQVIAIDYVRTTVRGKTVFRWEWQGRISPWAVIAYMPFPESCDLA